MQIEDFVIWNGQKPFVDPKDSARTEHIVERGEYDGIDRFIDITEPVVTYFPAACKGPCPAVLVCPGGGYTYVAWTHEGRDIAGMLNGSGFAAFVLKYRCPDQRIAAHADAARAMRFIRANAERFLIDPKRVGCIGFSAGAHLCATISAPAQSLPYEPQDEIDKLSYRPDFTALIYPAYLSDGNGNLAPEFKVDKNTPPTFLVQAEDDFCNVELSLDWYRALKRAGIPAEMHLYAEGAHGYGLHRTGFPVSNWGTLAADWFRRQAGIK